MRTNNNVCIVAGTHGDEFEFGRQVQRLVNIGMPNKAYMLNGNPRASAHRLRFLDSDLNRSFDGNGDGYEAERAEEVKEIIRKEGFTHVVDLHTSPTTHSIVPILPTECRGDKADRVINNLPVISDIVELMPESPASLISAQGQGGIALECPRYAHRRIAQKVAHGLMGLIEGKHLPKSPRSVHGVIGLVPEEADLGEAKIDDFRRVPGHGGEAFVVAPAIYKALGYGHQGMVVKYRGERMI